MYTNINSKSAEGLALLGMHFIQQATPDIRRKSKMTPTEQLVEMTFSAFYNQNRAKEKKTATTQWK